MKYLEELTYGECFKYNNELFILTSDFKNNDTKLCYNLNSGFPKWLKNDSMIDVCPIYTMSTDNNLTPVKEYKSDAQVINNLR